MIFKSKINSVIKLYYFYYNSAIFYIILNRICIYLLPLRPLQIPIRFKHSSTVGLRRFAAFSALRYGLAVRSAVLAFPRLMLSEFCIRFICLEAALIPNSYPVQTLPKIRRAIKKAFKKGFFLLRGSPGRVWTYDPPVNSRMLYRWATEEYLESGSYLSSRAVTSQVLWAYKGLTSVFGMGTGGTP